MRMYDRGRRQEFTILREPPEMRRAKQREYQARYRAANGDKMKAQTKDWYNKNKALCTARSGHQVSLRRIAKARETNPSLPQQPDLTPEQREACIAIRLEAQTRSVLLGTPHVVDHIEEIADGGLELPGNLQILTFEQHNRKTNDHRKALREQYLKSRSS